MLFRSPEKSVEKKRKITNEEVTGQNLAQTNLETVLRTILEYEKKFAEEKKAKDGQHLIELYNKIIEFYTGIRNDFESAQSYLSKLKLLLNDEELQKNILLSDTGTQ